jgi:hypothetical protein
MEWGVYTLEWSGSIGCNYMKSSGKGSTTAADLRKSGARLGDNSRHPIKCVLSLALGTTQAIRRGFNWAEDGGVDLCLIVGSCTRDDTALDAKCSCVATSIPSLKELALLIPRRRVTYDDWDFAVGCNERRCCESNEKDVDKHSEIYEGYSDK